MADQKPMINVTRGTVVCEGAVLADRPLQRMRGLLGRDSLRPGEGLLLQPAPSIHTAFMRFPIDVVFLDSESVVVRVVHTLAPWRAAQAQRARSVLELAAGEGERRGVKVGDWLIRVSEDLIWASAEGDGPPVDTLGAGGGSSDAALHGQALVAPRAVRDASHEMPELLLVSRDRRFRAVMAVLLSARGFSVTPATHYPDGGTGAPTGAEVVVIDAWDSLVNAEAAAMQAGWMAPDRTVVFVSDSGEAATTAAPVFPKWGSLEHLCDEIASARRRAVEELEARQPRDVPQAGVTHERHPSDQALR
jgi:uncharacterized membrane protein (UPF0127 family)